MTKCNQPCSECPWIIENSHNKKFREWSEKMNSLGYKQKCHMHTNNIWDKKINSNNECVGKKLINQKQQ